jgi:hypothetical protein
MLDKITQKLDRRGRPETLQGKQCFGLGSRVALATGMEADMRHIMQALHVTTELLITI